MTVMLGNEALVTCDCGAHIFVHTDWLRPDRLDFGSCSTCGRLFTLLLSEHGLAVKPGGVG